jgi:hypothetical protein
MNTLVLTGTDRRSIRNTARIERKVGHGRWLGWTLTALWLAVAYWSLDGAVDYYRMPMAERVFDDAHALYSPTGVLGHGYGLVGSLFMLVGIGMYSARKRLSILQGVGKLRTWLTVHIFLCTLGPFLVTLHTAFRVGGIISIAFWSMALVVASGVFGRYVYARLPRGDGGTPVSPVALKRQTMELRGRIKAHGLTDRQVATLLDRSHTEELGLIRALSGAIRFDLHRKRLPRELRLAIAPMGLSAAATDRLVPELVKHRMLCQQLAIARPFQRLFGYWHVFHLPLALVMVLIMTLHIGVAFAFGYFWIQ